MDTLLEKLTALRGSLEIAKENISGILAAIGDVENRVVKTGQPQSEFVRIPAGTFVMGSDRTEDRMMYDNEGPKHEVDVPEYYMARCPVTESQYVVFAHSRDQGGTPHYCFSGDRCRLDHPVVDVSWYNAMAYCHWLVEQLVHGGETLGLPAKVICRIRSGAWVVRLPTEAEWEKAARGGLGIPDKGGFRENPYPARLWPWGNEWNPENANVENSSGGGTNPVGAYPSGASPYGILDMAGNVWEWTYSLYKDYPYRADDGREGPSKEGIRVLRGGSWIGDQRSARCAYRGYDLPDDRLGSIGFRVVAAPALEF